MRDFSTTTYETAKRRFYEICTNVAVAHGCTAEIEWDERYPVTENPPAQAKVVRSLASKAFGEDMVVENDPYPASEDFAYFL
jgi:hippurate hydrolase